MLLSINRFGGLYRHPTCFFVSDRVSSGYASKMNEVQFGEIHISDSSRKRCHGAQSSQSSFGSCFL